MMSGLSGKTRFGTRLGLSAALLVTAVSGPALAGDHGRHSRHHGHEHHWREGHEDGHRGAETVIVEEAPVVVAPPPVVVAPPPVAVAPPAPIVVPPSGAELSVHIGD